MVASSFCAGQSARRRDAGVSNAAARSRQRALSTGPEDRIRRDEAERARGPVADRIRPDGEPGFV